MLFRLLLVFISSALCTASAWACSCAPWSGNVSEFSETHISVWAVPTEATVNIENHGKPARGVTYKLEVLEGFDRINLKTMSVSSNVANGGSCGIDLTMGLPQFISAYKHSAEYYSLSMCTPLVPYDALKLYLQTGEDSFIPEWIDCHSWPNNLADETPILNQDIKECAVWKGADHVINDRLGAKDELHYREIWWNKIETPAPKKKRHWWQFNKD